jgi:hypothetical protein
MPEGLHVNFMHDRCQNPPNRPFHLGESPCPLSDGRASIAWMTRRDGSVFERAGEVDGSGDSK